jgi:hypothetical protein
MRVIATDVSTTPNGVINWDKIQSAAKVDSIVGEKNPLWKSQVRDVVSATTPLVGTKWRFWWTSYPSAKAMLYNKTNPQKDKLHWITSVLGIIDESGGPTTFLPSVVAPPADVVTSANNRAIAKLTDQLNALQSLAKVGEDLGEIRQTAKALARPFAPVRKVVLDSFELARKGLRNRRQPISIAKSLADAHLEFAFGWKPLANSIASSIVSLQNREFIGLYHPFHVKGETTFNGSNVQSYSNITGGVGAVFDSQRSSKITVVYQGVWEEKCKLPEQSVNRALGLTLMDVLPTIWNLIPCSFLADYFANIGKIIEALNSPWADVAWCNRTQRVEYNLQVNVGFYNSTPSALYGSILQTPGVFKASATTFTRSKQTSRPLPELEFTNLRDITRRQWLNMAALTLSQGAKLALSIGKAVQRHPKLPEMFIEQLNRQGGYRDPYPFHRGK